MAKKRQRYFLSDDFEIVDANGNTPAKAVNPVLTNYRTDFSNPVKMALINPLTANTPAQKDALMVSKTVTSSNAETVEVDQAKREAEATRQAQAGFDIKKFYQDNKKAVHIGGGVLGAIVIYKVIF